MGSGHYPCRPSDAGVRAARAPGLSLAIGSLSCLLPLIAANAQQPGKPWESPYTDEDVTGAHVIGLWQFEEGQELKDNSGRGHDLTLRGRSRSVKDGKFGSCLECFAAPGDKPEGVSVRNRPELTPPGAFTLELWIKLKKEEKPGKQLFLLDKKYYHYFKDVPQANHDYCLFMTRSAGEQFSLTAFLGFGKDSVVYRSSPVTIPTDEWHYVAFTYDGKGMGRFFLDGRPVGRTVYDGRGPISHGPYNLHIGARVGSTHIGFPGYIDQVRITKGIAPFLTGNLEVGTVAGRTAFLRMERDAKVLVSLWNDTGKPLTNVTLAAEIEGRDQTVPVGDIAISETRRLEVPVDTSLRPSTYDLRVLVKARGPEQEHTVKKDFPVTIAPRPLPHQMPVVLWGGGDLERLQEIGFTHQLIGTVDFRKVWEAGGPIDAWTPETGQRLDRYLASGFRGLAYLYPASWLHRSKDLKEKYGRIDHGGKPYGKANVCGRFPEVREFCFNVGASAARSYGHYPALEGALVHSEVRDGTDLCFHKHDTEPFRAFAGHAMPADVLGKGGVPHGRLRGFPISRVVPDDHPVLTFYRWFWTTGDGWNNLHSQVHRGLNSTGRKNLWTFFDPAVRVPSVWGSGGEVDVVSQWTYSYPDPIKIGQATDELLAMAEGRPGQKVMKMTQVIWYRSGTAPELPKDESKRAQWENDIPDARFVTIAPDHLREAFWSKLSRPIRGIMYHGWSSLVQVAGNTHAYRFTNPRSHRVLTELTRTVIRPLGPTLLQVPDRQADVGVLESFSSQVFAGRGTWGWSHQWEADLHLVLQWAQLQPRILFDETVVRDGLDSLRVLFLPNCDVLTESVVKRVAAFQQQGGLVVADEHLTPALVPDILVQSFSRTGDADKDKAALQARARSLREELDPFYKRYGESSNPDVVVRFREYGDTDYLFAINDHRTFGDYVGHHGKVMEKGLPSSSKLVVYRAKGYVYDLVAHQSVPSRTVDNRVVFEADFGPGDGRLFMVTEGEISKVEIDAPRRARLGQSVGISVSVTGSRGRTMPAVVPVRLEVLDPENRPAEPTGWYGAKDGQATVSLELAPNDMIGEWTIRATELASDLSCETKLLVER